MAPRQNTGGLSPFCKTVPLPVSSPDTDVCTEVLGAWQQVGPRKRIRSIMRPLLQPHRSHAYS